MKPPLGFPFAGREQWELLDQGVHFFFGGGKIHEALRVKEPMEQHGKIKPRNQTPPPIPQPSRAPRPRDSDPFSIKRVLLLLGISLPVFLLFANLQSLCACRNPRLELRKKLQEVRGQSEATLGVLMSYYRDGHLFRGIALEEALGGEPETKRWAMEVLDQAVQKKDWETLTTYFSVLEDPKKISIWTALETLKALRQSKEKDSNRHQDLERTLRFRLYEAEGSLIHPFEIGKIFALLEKPAANRFQIQILGTLLLLKSQDLDENEEAFLIQAKNSQRD